ncbi:MAG: protein-disulfide reductase DsbD family protein, partial [Limisphaerales bacterium]
MLRHLLLSLAWLLAAGLSGAAPATSVRLLVPVEAARPGDIVTVGIELTMKPGWHTYWKHGGDSGGPTTVKWEVPPGITAGEIRWPAPEWYLDNGFVTFVHHARAVLLVPLTIAADAPAGPVELRAEVAWLECEKLCIPGRGSVSGLFVIGAENQPSAAAATVAAAEKLIPPPLSDGAARAYWDGPPADGQRRFVILWNSPGTGGTPDFFWDGEGEGFEVRAAGDVLASDPGTALLRRSIESREGRWPAEVSGLLVRRDPRGLPLAAHAATLRILDAPPPGAAVPAGARPARISLPLALGLGILGGLILNIMPCVLPVIALKILGFVREAGSRPAEVRKLGLIYGLGVWFSFLVLAGVVIAVKKATGLASWGMQFSNPVFLVAIAVLVTLVALSLFGVFEITLGGGVDDAAGKLARKDGPAGAFFNGVLAVILATPCTAPFLAPALGLAFASNAPTIVAVFSAVAFGLALPYVLLSWNPAWLKWVPKPGPWMGRFKTAMGFPMLGTAVWLYTLAAPHFGKGGWLWLGLFLVVLALAAWVWGEFLQRGAR